MSYHKNIFFIAGRNYRASGVYLPNHKIIITANEAIANQKEALVKFSNKHKEILPIIYSDSLLNLAFIQAPDLKEYTKLSFSSIAVSVNQNITVIGKSLLGHPIEKMVIIKGFTDLNNNKVYDIDTQLTEQTNGGLATDTYGNIIGIAIRNYSKKQDIILPGNIIMPILDELKQKKYALSLRCPVCHKIILKENIIEKTCPNCGIILDDKILGKEIPKKDEITLKVEKILSSLGKNIALSTIGKHFWEIEEGSATIYIRYGENENFITAFSVLTELKDKNKSKVLDFLLTENEKLPELSFAIHKDLIFLVSNYIYKKDFDEKLGRKIFHNIVYYADYYDDIIIKMQEE